MGEIEMGKRMIALLLGALLLLMPVCVAGAEGMLLPEMGVAEIAGTVDAFVEAHRATTAAVSVGVSRDGQVLFERA